MSAPRCGYCNAPTLNGTLCKNDWRDLRDLLHRCRGIDDDLEMAVQRRMRHGEVVSASTVPGLPLNMDAAEARRDLHDALNDALRGLLGGLPRLTASGAAGLILGHSRRLLGSYIAPVLLGDLAAVVPRAVAVTDKPRNTPGVRAACPRCGHRGFLRAVMGSLECSGCRERVSIGEVRSAA
ncbi:MAG: hypothetical protein L0G94_14045 [Brachybacterium sp.]|uniref:hypothetical protein n=1 Tax=Brachybacterium sp. TaxID=1891286 RepID=UPI0026497A71|nr:hypothetical protein [Brachybacterium sp.]MDN5687774.1 hypothetical protein [Brachybacterium sp.]